MKPAVWLVHDGVAAPPRNWFDSGFPEGSLGQDFVLVLALDHDSALEAADTERVLPEREALVAIAEAAESWLGSIARKRRPTAAEICEAEVQYARAARADGKKEPNHPVVTIDPRDACLDEIAELLRGECGADEIAEISRIVRSSGRKL